MTVKGIVYAVLEHIYSDPRNKYFQTKWTGKFTDMTVKMPELLYSSVFVGNEHNPTLIKHIVYDALIIHLEHGPVFEILDGDRRGKVGEDDQIFLESVKKLHIEKQQSEKNPQYTIYKGPFIHPN